MNTTHTESSLDSLTGHELLQIRLGQYSTNLNFSGDLRISIESSVVFRGSELGPAEMGALASLLGATLDSASWDSSGLLHLHLSSNREVVVQRGRTATNRSR